MSLYQVFVIGGMHSKPLNNVEEAKEYAVGTNCRFQIIQLDQDLNANKVLFTEQDFPDNPFYGEKDDHVIASQRLVVKDPPTAYEIALKVSEKLDEAYSLMLTIEDSDAIHLAGYIESAREEIDAKYIFDEEL